MALRTTAFAAVLGWASVAWTVTPAAAGAPFLTDDGVPTDTGHWEAYAFASGARAARTAGQAGLELDYGAAKDLQLTAIVPIAHETGTGAGFGNVQLAAKYRVLHQGDPPLSADVAIAPLITFPTGGRRWGSGRTSVLLPIWVSKDIGAWSLFGGGGYDINPGPGRRNFWQSGFGVVRKVTDRLSLGAEAYHHTRDVDDDRAFTGVNIAVLYRMTSHWSLIASVGPGVENAREEGRYAFYAALKADY